MLTAINIGQILSFYPSDDGTLRSFHNGYGLLASNTKLINFSIEIGGGDFFWRLRGLNGSPDTPLNNDRLVDYEDEDLNRILTYNGAAVNAPCGTYEIVVNRDGNEFVSDVIEVVDMTAGYERAGLTTVRPEGVSAPPSGPDLNPNVYIDDTVIGSIQSAIWEYSHDGGTVWVEILGSYYQTANTPDEDVLLRRSITTQYGAYTVMYTLRGQRLIPITPVIDPCELKWKLTISDTVSRNRILYGEGYEQTFYFRGPVSSLNLEERAREEIPNGQGETVLTYSEIHDTVTVTATGIPDSAISGLYEGKNRTTEIKRAGSLYGLTTKGYEIGVTADSYDTNTVTLTFKRGVLLTRCNEPPLIVRRL